MNEAAQTTKKEKSVALAMILNATPLVMFGLGYLYLGKWVCFVIVESLQLFSLIAFFTWGLRTEDLLALVWVGSVIDILIQTLNHNQQLLKATDGLGLLSR